MVKLKNSFQRKEKKYALSYEMYHKLKEELQVYMQEDEYGLHTIISVYFDTQDYEMIRQSIAKPTYKEKFRIRSYGVPKEHSEVFLEIKKKVLGVVYKRRISLPYRSAKRYIQHPHSLKLSSAKEQQIKQEIDWLFARKRLQPKVMIAYDRRALFALDNHDFRVTFDFNIRFRQEYLTKEITDFGERVAPEIDVLMEVKALGAYPLWFSEILAAFEVYPCSFSKYAQAYQRYLYCREDFYHVV
ncbi:MULTISPECIES: polyphosphate polymerase domain-containing protein [unclassified Enterococcus]|uniref:polyphosphate polymerase domain-containing protein n=1 Tax=unclassified Enterococcus TaxID=2608891 RepID=UPI001CE192CF|nr:MULTISPECIES: polyphosphate polymerase domain-containing protein [unclassified Enterococcus]MCA5012777.1 polyphosphate polymerase domain-containing protein [Enterococcus sp. S23]MCA5016028.1 polyphosphate polymerase domain-containing protein [Enterococcus sp. S22(2020)]